MKKTSIALMIGLFAVGCGEAPKKATTNTAPMPDPAQMAKHMMPPGGAPAKTEEKKEEDKKAEGEAPAAAPAAEADAPK